MLIESLRTRLIIIAVVLAATLFLLYPSVGPVPEWWQKNLPANAVRLGLDLQGGLHLILEVEREKAVEASVDQAMNEASSLMKKEGIRYSNMERVSSDSFAVYLSKPEQEPLFDSTVLPTLASFRKLGTSPTEKGLEIKVGIDPKVAEGIRQAAVTQAVETIRNRVDAFGVAEPDVVVHGDERLIVQLPGLKEDINRAIDLIKKTARLEFKLVYPDPTALSAAQKGRMPPGTELLYEIRRNPRTGAITRQPYLLEKPILMTGDVITDARVTPDNQGGWMVGLDLNNRGAEIFGRITTENVGRNLAIVLDDEVQSAPVIQTPILDGSAVITGNFTAEQASDLKIVLQAGSLPAPVKILERKSVGPSLGADSIRLGRNAVILGLILVVIGMAVYYRVSGLVADVALVLNLLLIFAIMVSPGLRATLTLPGLAGVALTMGMAIDANILIFERIREELRLGKTPKAAWEAGYTKAFSTIFDSNLTTILAALPLIQFGTGPIKGFAVTLTIGLLVSMFTALFVTRTIFDYAFQQMRVKSITI